MWNNSNIFQKYTLIRKLGNKFYYNFVNITPLHTKKKRKEKHICVGKEKLRAFHSNYYYYFVQQFVLFLFYLFDLSVYKKDIYWR